MAPSDFHIAYAITNTHEGGYVNDPDDPGGETYKGISRRWHPEWLGWDLIDLFKHRHDFPGILENSPKLLELVRGFYSTRYWHASGCHLMPQLIANEVYDTAVNLGPQDAIRFLQQSLNALNRNGKCYDDLLIDGQFGRKTLRALDFISELDELELLYKMMNVLQGAEYLENMRRSPVKEKYARGWFRRVEFAKS